jgi:hypothetical protein
MVDSPEDADYSESPEYQSSMAVDSDDIASTSPKPFYQQLLKRMSPAECLLPATQALQLCSDAAYKSCLASDREEFDWILTGLLKDIRRPHKQRGPALHTLYRLTDREHAQNRYVHEVGYIGTLALRESFAHIAIQHRCRVHYKL